MIEDGAFDQGSVTRVQRIGATIRRPTGPWTPTVHTLLRHLEQVGFGGAPRVLGFDDDGREILSLLHGAAALRPWPPILHRDAGLIALARMLRAYHTAVETFVPPPDAQWFVPGLRWAPGQIVRHGDVGPWNTIWVGDALVGMIDWDSIEPGSGLEDLAQLVWYAVPLRDDAHARAAGFADVPDRLARLRVLCAAYGATPAAVVDAVDRIQQLEQRRTTELAGRGLEPWVTFRSRGDGEQIGREMAWLLAHRDWLVDA